MSANRKTVLLPQTLGKAAWDLFKGRDDIETIGFANSIVPADFLALLQSTSQVNALIVGMTPIREPDIAAAKGLAVVARIGVGYDAIDIPALTKRGIPLMVVGTANSPSVAEQALFFMLALAKHGAELDRMTRDDRWDERFNIPGVDLFGKTVLIVGFGRIGTRTAKRCQAMEMTVLVYDPYVADDNVRAAGCEPVRDLDAALPRADFVTIHCPKAPETVRMFDAKRLARMKRSAYLVNTARGGIIDETALYAALTERRLAGAGLDVFEQEPTPPDNPLLKLENLITSPHMAGVTVESIDRMAAQVASNVLSVFDGNPIAENVINREVLARG